MKNYLIDQPGSLGDILFTIKIAEELNAEGSCTWNINPVFWERGLKRLETNFRFGIRLGEKPDSEVIKLTDLTDRSDPDIMTKKYDVVGIEWENWSNYLSYERDKDIEKALFNKLDLNWDEPFILTNDTYGVNQKHLGVGENLPNDYDGKIINLNVYPEFTIFDWCSIFEKAEQIHTVDTSIQYVIETLDTTDKLTVYPRHYLYTIPQVSKLFTKPWNWIECDRETWLQWAPNESEF